MRGDTDEAAPDIGDAFAETLLIGHRECGVPRSRWILLVGVAFVIVFLPGLGGDVHDLQADIQAVRARPSYASAWYMLGGADFEPFMAFCRRRIPPSGSVMAIVLQPAFGYYRGNYDLYPRTVWPYVSPLGAQANDPHAVSEELLRNALRATHARYLVVWHVTLPRPLPAYRWVATFAPDEYVVALR